MKRTLPGEIWRVDLGLAAKVRPALVLSDYPQDDELALLVVIPHTTAVRGNRWELAVPKAFLKSPGAFHVQQNQPISLARLEAPAWSVDAGRVQTGQRSFDSLVESWPLKRPAPTPLKRTADPLKGIQDGVCESRGDVMPQEGGLAT
jgi:mRNA interferase MazF